MTVPMSDADADAYAWDVLGDPVAGTPADEVSLYDFDRAYKTAVHDLDDPMYAHAVQQGAHALLEAAADYGDEKLAALGVEPGDPDIYHVTSELGVTTTVDGPMLVGSAGSTEREFNLSTVMAHEKFHHHVMHVQGVEEYTAREEAMSKILDLHWMGVLDDEERREEVLQEERELYNNAVDASVPSGFGDRLYKQANNFIAVMEKDREGLGEEGVRDIIQFYFDFYLDNADSAATLNGKMEE